MRYLCVNCQYILDEDKWEIDYNIDPWTKFENFWDSFVCPSCGELPENFHEIKEEINYLWEIPFDVIEAEHFINFEFLNNSKINISVWKWEFHPTWLDHRITSIWIYDEYWDLVFDKYYKEDEDPVLDFDISDFDDFEIRVRCSIHGVWGVKIER